MCIVIYRFIPGIMGINDNNTMTKSIQNIKSNTKCEFQFYCYTLFIAEYKTFGEESFTF